MSTTIPHSGDSTDAVRAVGLDPTDPRTDRALTEQMTVRACGRFAYEVYAESGNTYFVHLGAEACTCPDWRQRHPKDGCKHLRRVRLERARLGSGAGDE
jgi:predicted nucleic acid-binding Zn finger protein